MEDGDRRPPETASQGRDAIRARPSICRCPRPPSAPAPSAERFSRRRFPSPLCRNRFWLALSTTLVEAVAAGGGRLSRATPARPDGQRRPAPPRCAPRLSPPAVHGRGPYSLGGNHVKAPQLVGGEGRHYVGGKQVQRAHALRARQSPPGERTNDVVAATLRCDTLHLSAHPVRRSEDDAFMLDRRLPREQAVDA